MIQTEIERRVALVTMDNPPVNAQPMEFMEELIGVFDALNDRDDVSSVVLTGAGKVFSAGADLKRRQMGEAEPGAEWKRLRLAREVGYSIMECRKPVVGAVNGAALGAGLCLAATCDILVAADTAVFGLPEIDVGLMGGARHAMRILPHSLVRRMALTGYRAPAAELYRRGVIEACLPASEVLDFALGIARDIAAKSPIAVTLCKDSLSTIETLTLRDGYRYEQSNTNRLTKTEDAREAAKAFLERRPPVFVGR